MGLVLGMMVMGVYVVDGEDDIWLFQQWRTFTRPYENIPTLEHVDGIQDKLLAGDYPGEEDILNHLKVCGTPKGSRHTAGIIDTLPPRSIIAPLHSRSSPPSAHIAPIAGVPALGPPLNFVLKVKIISINQQVIFFQVTLKVYLL